MASSSTSLSRSRSLRKPTAGVGGGGDVAATALRSEARNTSPSRLPVKPTSTAAAPTRTGSTASASAVSSTSGAGARTRPRPISGVLGRGLSTRKAPTPPSDTESTRDGLSSRTTVARRPSPTTSTTVPTAPTSASARNPPSRPTTSAGIPSSGTAGRPRGAAHTRAKSSATALTASTVLRPPTSTSATSSQTGPGSRPPVTTRSNAPSSSLHRRQASQPNASLSAPPPTASTASTTSSGSASTTTATTRLKPSATESAPRLRPAFTTLQQHYSPARSLAPKPLTATFLAPPSPSKLPANVAASAETARLQAQLLQLHLLHRGAPAVDAAWRASAQRALRGRFVALAADSADLAAEERSLAERENAAAMRAWGGGQLEEKVQALDGVLSGLWSLGEPVGKYARVVRRFERWLDRTVDVVEARRRWEGGGAGAGATELLPTRGEDGAAGEEGELEALFVGELGAQWKEECAGLARKLDGWRRQLWELGPAEDETIAPEEGAADTIGAGRGPSSLARILHGCAALVADMLAELGAMEQIERDAVAQETEWVRRMSREEDGAGGRGAAKAGAIWRAF